MTEKTQSFIPFDVSKILTEFEPSKMMGQFTKAFTDYKIRGVDMSAVVEHQRKNVDALTAANKRALEGVQAVATRQSEILKETMDGAVNALKQLATSGGPSEVASKQAELLKSALEKALSNMRDLAEMTAKANTDAFDVISHRLTASLGEIKEMAKSLTSEEAKEPGKGAKA